MHREGVGGVAIETDELFGLGALPAMKLKLASLSNGFIISGFRPSLYTLFVDLLFSYIWI